MLKAGSSKRSVQVIYGGGASFIPVADTLSGMLIKKIRPLAVIITRSNHYGLYNIHALTINDDRKIVFRFMANPVALEKDVAAEVIAFLLAHGARIGTVSLPKYSLPTFAELPFLGKRVALTEDSITLGKVTVKGKVLRPLVSFLAKYKHAKLLAPPVLEHIAVTFRDALVAMDPSIAQSVIKALSEMNMEELRRARPEFMRDVILTFLRIITDDTSVEFVDGVGVLIYGVPMREIEKVVHIDYGDSDEIYDTIVMRLLKHVVPNGDGKQRTHIASAILSPRGDKIVEKVLNHLSKVRTTNELRAWVITAVLKILNYRVKGNVLEIPIKDNQLTKEKELILRYLGCEKGDDVLKCQTDKAFTKLIKEEFGDNVIVTFDDVIGRLLTNAINEMGLVREVDGELLVDEDVLGVNTDWLAETYNNKELADLTPLSGLSLDSIAEVQELVRTQRFVAAKISAWGHMFFVYVEMTDKPKAIIIIEYSLTENDVFWSSLIGFAIRLWLNEKPRKRKVKVPVGDDVYIFTRTPETVKKIIEIGKPLSDSYGMTDIVTESGESLNNSYVDVVVVNDNFFRTFSIDEMTAIAKALLGTELSKKDRELLRKIPVDKVISSLSMNQVLKIYTVTGDTEKVIKWMSSFCTKCAEIVNMYDIDFVVSVADKLIHGKPTCLDELVKVAVINNVLEEAFDSGVSGIKNGKIYVSVHIISDYSINLVSVARRHGCALEAGALVCETEKVPSVLHEALNSGNTSFSHEDIFATAKTRSRHTAEILGQIKEGISTGSRITVTVDGTITEYLELTDVLSSILGYARRSRRNMDTRIIDDMLVLLSALRIFNLLSLHHPEVLLS